METKVFVYGTLKSDQPMHSYFANAERGSYRLVGTGKTSTKWPLVIATKFNIPFLLDMEGQGHHIRGEVYEVDDDMLKTLDYLEDYPELYDRRRTVVELDCGGPGAGVEAPATVECWFYVLPKERPALKDLPRFESYDSNGSHGKKFVTLYDTKSGWLIPFAEIKNEFTRCGLY
ncbi:putative gamma-glutamylcyclotransferase CG2811 [Diadema antillarum]|uniref:putative gamma-glutamylcyclotransferase CG2811 n=1 Tax=Diadema antillarum TaxID=105358 RepID=UPI003A83670A